MLVSIGKSFPGHLIPSSELQPQSFNVPRTQSVFLHVFLPGPRLSCSPALHRLAPGLFMPWDVLTTEMHSKPDSAATKPGAGSLSP